MRCIIRAQYVGHERATFRRHRVCVSAAAFVLLIAFAAAALTPEMASAGTQGEGARVALASDTSSRSASPTTRRQVAIRRLQVAARNLHRTVDKVVRVPDDADFLAVTQAQFDRAELILAIRHARTVGLSVLAGRYQRVLDVETKRLNQARAFTELLSHANDYGQHVAQKAHEKNPSLPATVLGNIAVNAASWYGNDALLKVTLRAAKQTKNPRVYELTLKKGEDLDRRTYALYRSLSVGARRTGLRYGGREGLHELPDAQGGFNGGLIGFRRAAETSDGKSPAIDIKTADGKAFKIHVRGS
jgi:hypothetical protein